mmetsp:Transcript_81480/g.230887  ORF Transcript_81480/g.230887 Transcript_81480/m.230887 type:complete len:378 (+) Transcript_81480:246-1379(+)
MSGFPAATPEQQQSSLAAMMWQMQMMGSPHGNPAMMVPPWAAPSMPVVPPTLDVRVDGLTFEYQLTEDDVRKVFARYGEVFHVDVDREGTTARVQFREPHQAINAQHDLDRKQLAGMSGAFLRVEFAAPTYNPALAQMAAATAAANPYAVPAMLPAAMPGAPALQGGAARGAQGDPGRPKKFTCKLEVGVENEAEFRVGSRAIQIARHIWQDAAFQEHGGKTRLRGKGIGGPHEADEPLALCISCRDQAAFDKAVHYAEAQLQKVHADYRAFCQQRGRPVPDDLAVKVSKKGFSVSDDAALPSSTDLPRGERPAGAPGDEEIEHLIEERNEARKTANFKRADEIRDYLKSRGVVLMDEKGAKGNFNGLEVTTWRFWR